MRVAKSRRYQQAVRLSLILFSLNCVFSDRIGNTPRFVEVDGLGKFESFDNLAIDKVIKNFHGSSHSNFVHLLESHWRFVATALVTVIAFSWLFAVYGIPALAHGISKVLPQKLVVVASQQTLATLDGLYFEHSELKARQQQRIVEHFLSLTPKKKELNINIQFRQGGSLGANAFALPDGTIIFTDELVALSENNDELLTIYAHEVGHVEYRHGTRSVIQGSLLTFLLLLFTGDAGAAAESFLALPVILTELAYSRKFELEADRYAHHLLRENNVNPEHFINIMKRLENLHLCGDLHSTEPDMTIEMCKESIETNSGKTESTTDKIGNYFSTHPATNKRLEQFEQLGNQ